MRPALLAMIMVSAVVACSAHAANKKYDDSDYIAKISLSRSVPVEVSLTDERKSVFSRGLKNTYAGKIQGSAFGSDAFTSDKSPVADYTQRMIEDALINAVITNPSKESASPKILALVLKYFEWSSNPSGGQMRWDVDVTISTDDGTVLATEKVRGEASKSWKEVKPPHNRIFTSFMFSPAIQAILMNPTVNEALVN